jgi:hypothetical protein
LLVDVIFPYFSIIFPGKFLGDSIGAPGRVAIKFSCCGKNCPLWLNCSFLNNLIKMRPHCLRTGPLTDLKGFCENFGLGKGISEKTSGFIREVTSRLGAGKGVGPFVASVAAPVEELVVASMPPFLSACLCQVLFF